jgi:hypothetical protein
MIAACRELCPHSEDWYAAVRALGAASQAGFPAPDPQPVRKGWRERENKEREAKRRGEVTA